MQNILILIAIVCVSCGFAAEPRIEVVGPAKVDFGRYNAWEARTASYTIKNSGDSDLEILRVRKTCGCAEAKCSKMRLAPGEEAVIEVKVIPDSIFGRYSKATYVESNDKNSPVLSLMMTGEAVPLVEVKPSEYCYAGRIDKGAEWKQSFVFKMNQPGVKLGEPVLTNSHPATVQCRKNDSGGVEGCDVSLLPIDGNTEFELILVFPVLEPAGHSPVKICIDGKVGRELVAVPGTMRFGLTKEPAKRKFFLKVMGSDDIAVTSDRVSVPEVPGVTFTLKDDKVRNCIEVDAVFSPEFIDKVISSVPVVFSFKIEGAASARVVCRSLEKQERKNEKTE